MYNGKRKVIFQVFTITILVLLCIAMIKLYFTSRNLEIENYSLVHKNILAEKVHDSTIFLNRRIDILELIAQSDVAKEVKQSELENMLYLVNRWGDFTQIYFLSAEGKVIFPVDKGLYPRSSKFVPLIPFSEHSILLSSAKESKKTQISNFLHIPPSGKGLLICSPVYKDNLYIGSVVGALSLDIIKEDFTVEGYTNDNLFVLSPQGDFIFAPADFKGENYLNLVTDSTGESYQNYLDMCKGNSNFMVKHTLPFYYKGSSNYIANYPQYLSYAPVIVGGKFLFSLAVATPVSTVLEGNNYHLVNIILMIGAIAGTFFGFLKYNRRSRELLASEVALEEKGKYLGELENLNSQLKTQKESYSRLWEETALLNTELFDKNKSLNEQKQFIEALWEETNALNEELIQKNEKLLKLNEKVAKEKENLLIINTIGEYMVSPADMQEVLKDIVKLIEKIINFSAGAILKYDPQNNYLEKLIAIGYEGKEELKQGVKINEGLCGYAARKKEIVLVNDVSKDERYVIGLEETKAELVIPLLVKDELIGVLSLQRTSPFDEFAQEEELILRVLGNNLAMVIKNHQLAEEVRESFLDIVKVLVRAIEAKDIYTSGHCERVKVLALQIGEYLNLDKADLEILELAALLHDIGKIGMPEEILNKKDKLTPGEYELIKKHPSVGYSLLSGIKSLERINKIILQHHERIDGTGYPNQLQGEEIDILAKILAVADAVDAMTSARPYRGVQPLEYVLDQLDICSGVQFDKEIAAIAKIILIKDFFQVNDSEEAKTV